MAQIQSILKIFVLDKEAMKAGNRKSEEVLNFPEFLVSLLRSQEAMN